MPSQPQFLKDQAPATPLRPPAPSFTPTAPSVTNQLYDSCSAASKPGSAFGQELSTFL